jgi:putative transposase
MWTQENQRKHKVDRSRAKRGYPTDVSDQEWALMAPLFPGAERTGRPCKTDFRAAINALSYQTPAEFAASCRPDQPPVKG